MAEPKTRPTTASVPAFLAKVKDAGMREDAAGRVRDWPLVALSPRAKNLVLYAMPGFEGYDDLMKALGPVSHGVSCIYVKRLSAIHLPALKALVKASIAHVKTTFGGTR